MWYWGRSKWSRRRRCSNHRQKLFHPAPGAQQQDQHKNAPEDTKGSKPGAQLILAQGKEDFLQTVHDDFLIA